MKKPAKAIPKRITFVLNDQNVQAIRDPIGIVVDLLRDTSGRQYESLQLVWKDAKFGVLMRNACIEFTRDGTPIRRPYDASFWPVGIAEAGTGPDSINQVITQPRWKVLRDAVVTALHQHHDHVKITTYARDPGGRGNVIATAVRLRFSEDPDAVVAGATERWWRGLVQAAQPGLRPILHRGSDDPLL